MYNDVFKSLNESVKKRNSSSDFLPTEKSNLKDVIHRGYLRKSIYPIRYDMIPDGKTKNSGKHIYNFKSGNSNGFLEIDHSYDPSISGHETKSKINFELEGTPREDEIQIYRSFVIPSIMHHLDSHKPDIIYLNKTIPNVDDIVRRMGSSFDITHSDEKITAKRKMDPKISRIFSHIKNRINIKKGT